MFDKLIPVLYLQVSPSALTARNPGTGQRFSEPAMLALREDGKPLVVAIGSDAARHAGPGVRLARPFAHPRSLVSDFTAGELLLRHFLQRAIRRSWLTPAPRVVLHLPDDAEGGYTQVEIRAFHEMVLGAGASAVVVWQGPELSDVALRSGQFPPAGRRLN